MRETAFKRTPTRNDGGYIGHTGFPNQYRYRSSLKRYYRPDTQHPRVGDVNRQRALALTKKNFGDWQRGSYKPDIPREPEQDAPREAHIDWPSPTLPYLAVSFRAPAYSDEVKDKITLDLLGTIAFGENSDIYQRLVLKEQKVDFINAGGGDSVDPELFSIYTRVKKEEDVPYVREQILAAVERFTKELVPQQMLDDTRSRFRYGFAQGMDSSRPSPAIARRRMQRTPETLNRSRAGETVTPEVCARWPRATSARRTAPPYAATKKAATPRKGVALCEGRSRYRPACASLLAPLS